MARFSGPQPGYKSNGKNKGVMKLYKMKKRLEAEERQRKSLLKSPIDTTEPVVVE